MLRENDLILGKDRYYSMNDFETQLNNNVLVVGSSGCGKTRSIVSPNILQASGSYVISDPKGTLYKQYGRYLKEKGYEVQVLDFIHPKRSAKYNFFRYINTERDVIKLANILTYVITDEVTNDTFWDMATELLLSALIAYVKFRRKPHEHTLESVFKLLMACQIDEYNSQMQTPLDRIMEDEHNRYGSSFIYKQYSKFRVAAGKTLKSILVTVSAKLGKFDFDEINQMLCKDELNLVSLGRRNKAIFVIVSDTDRSMDPLANLFYTQAMNELCQYADERCENGRLPQPVRFILDDFATNCRIENFENMISNIRSRRISAMIMVQAESQLIAGYKESGKTIIANCDTYVYLGGNDLDTAKEVAVRCDLPYKKILNMPIGSNWIFRRGQTPVNGENFRLEDYKRIRYLAEEEQQAIAV